jgi:hypothetical protein
VTDIVRKEEIENASALVEVFGAWPSFHDAEVYSLAMSRESSEAPRLDMRIHVFGRRSEIDSIGQYGRVNHRFATLQFTRVAALELSGFNEQNALFALIIEPGDQTAAEPRRWDVRFESSYGVGATFGCDRIIVTNVEPIVEAG